MKSKAEEAFEAWENATDRDQEGSPDYSPQREAGFMAGFAAGVKAAAAECEKDIEGCHGNRIEAARLRKPYDAERWEARANQLTDSAAAIRALSEDPS